MSDVDLLGNVIAMGQRSGPMPRFDRPGPCGFLALDFSADPRLRYVARLSGRFRTIDPADQEILFRLHGSRWTAARTTDRPVSWRRIGVPHQLWLNLDEESRGWWEESLVFSGPVGSVGLLWSVTAPLELDVTATVRAWDRVTGRPVRTAG